MLKKTTLAVLGLAASHFAFAGTAGPVCVPGSVTVPCESARWNLGVQALYLKTAFDANNGYEFTPTEAYKDINNPWDWGFRLEGSYHFSTGNDLTLTWMHYDVDQNHTGYAGTIPISPPLFALNQPYSLRIENKFDQVNLVLGQHVDAGLLKNIRFYGGLQYADIRVDANNNFLGVPALLLGAGVFGVSQYHNTDFNGVGPVTGIDYAYNLTDCLSITANSALSLLYGTSRYSDGYIFSNGLIPASNYGIKRMIIPSLEAKLGVNYAYTTPYGLLNLEAGYQTVNYFNALQTRGPNSSGVFTNSDYALYGPYFGAKWIGNA